MACLRLDQFDALQKGRPRGRCTRYTLTCQIRTARCLLGRVFFLPTCVKSNDAISFFSTEASKEHWSTFVVYIHGMHNHQFCNDEAWKKPVLINNARFLFGRIEYIPLIYMIQLRPRTHFGFQGCFQKPLTWPTMHTVLFAYCFESSWIFHSPFG